MKVSELTGEKLAYWVGKAREWEFGIIDYEGTEWETDWQKTHKLWINEVGITDVGEYFVDFEKGFYIKKEDYRPDINGGQCFELIGEFDAAVHPTSENWRSTVYNLDHLPVAKYGDTPQEAICRAVVASVYGEEVSDES